MSYLDVIAPETGHSWGWLLGDSVVGWLPGRGLCVNPVNTRNALDGEHLVQGDLRGCRWVIPNVICGVVNRSRGSMIS